MTITVTVMSPSERRQATAAIMLHVEEVRRDALSGLLYCTPGALSLFASGYVYEAFMKIREHARAGHVKLSVGYDVDQFLTQILDRMPSEYRHATED